jgi:hypothetical protein
MPLIIIDKPPALPEVIELIEPSGSFHQLGAEEIISDFSVETHE